MANGRKPIIFLGESQQLIEMQETCDLIGIEVKGIIDKDFYGNTKDCQGIPYIGAEDAVDWQELKKDHDFFIPINPLPGLPRNQEKRKRFIDIVDQEDLPCVNIIDPQCRISPRATLGKGIFIGYNAYIAHDATIGDHCQIHLMAGINHFCKLGKNTIVNRAAALVGSITVGDNVYINTFAKIMNVGGRIGSDSTIPSGAMVYRNIEPGEKVTITSRKIYSAIADLPSTA